MTATALLTMESSHQQTPSGIASARCFHCLDDLPRHGTVFAEIKGVQTPFCCSGCLAVSRYIHDNALSEFYQRRAQSRSDVTTAGVIGSASAETQRSQDWSFLDDDTLNGDYVVQQATGVRVVKISVDGMYCESCSWLLNKVIQSFGPLITARIQPSTKTIDLRLLGDDVDFAAVLTAIESAGYVPTVLHKSDAESVPEQVQHAQRESLKRIAVAGFGMMQVMTYMAGVYLGEFQGIEPSFDRFLTLVSMLVATIVVFYSGKPFFDNAIGDLMHRRLGMDIPIALAIAGAYVPSVVITIGNLPGHVYFDSAVMFIFFLSLGRYLEQRARYRFSGQNYELTSLLPTRIRVQREDQTLVITPRESQAGDVVELQENQTIPFDGRVARGSLWLDESTLTGESRPTQREQGDPVFAGSTVVNGSGQARASGHWDDNYLTRISQSIGQKSNPESQHESLFDYLTRYFVVMVLAVTAIVGVIWWHLAPDRAFEIVLAMLVASCPCAFALAGPVSLAAASFVLRTQGILLANFEALSRLTHVSTWCFDKTGTLTRGRPRFTSIQCIAQIDEYAVRRIAAALEHSNDHAYSNLFTAGFEIDSSSGSAIKIHRERGNGVTGIVDGERYFLGKPDWVRRSSNCSSDNRCSLSGAESIVALANSKEVLAIFRISDQLRPGVDMALGALKRLGAQICVLSGDRSTTVTSTLADLPVDMCYSDQLPRQKRDLLAALQRDNSVVAMVGDGANDAPVLSQADVSLVLAHGSDIAKSTADVIILNGKLKSLRSLVDVAHQTKRVLQQNIAWALSYNVIVLPLAALGYITPWLAALGMSLSSLLVVLNALRITSQTSNREVS